MSSFRNSHSCWNISSSSIESASSLTSWPWNSSSPSLYVPKLIFFSSSNPGRSSSSEDSSYMSSSSNLSNSCSSHSASSSETGSSLYSLSPFSSTVCFSLSDSSFRGLVSIQSGFFVSLSTCFIVFFNLLPISLSS